MEPLSNRRMDFEELCIVAISPYQLEALKGTDPNLDLVQNQPSPHHWPQGPVPAYWRTVEAICNPGDL
ncbi:CDPK-related kinase 4 [Platanthera zijinensis]|uniref:CDPK-related kinase 4 n=1 Tax=Platanthera zijinensis TaxID=2320716 RepID=A0AAP0C0Z5_9ASPA